MNAPDGWTVLADNKSAVRGILPGDRLACALASLQKVTPCGESVAVVLQKTNRTVCGRHLAEYVLKAAGFGNRWGLDIRAGAFADARQMLIERHQSEFDELVETLTREVLASAFDMLPESLRTAVSA